MTMKKPTPVMPGQTSLSAADWNRYTQEVYRLSRLTVQTPLEMTNVGSNPQIRLIDPTIWAKITSSGWVEVQPDGDGGWTEIDNGREGTDEVNPAYEVNGNTASANSIVKLFPGLNGEYLYWFGGGDSFLALLTTKAHSETPFTAYGFIRVLDSDTPDPITYNGEPQQGTAYHEQNIDVPVAPTFATADKNAASGSVDSSAGDVNWTGPGNLTTSDDIYASSAPGAGQTTYYLTANNFGLGLPANAIVLSIGVKVEGNASATSVSDYEVKLIKGGTISGTNQATHTALTVGSDATMTYSGTPAQWGLNLSAADVNSASFGVALRYANSSGTESVNIDSVTISVTYAKEVARHSVVRMRKGNGDYYVFDQMPWEDLFIRSDSSDSDGVIGFLRYWDQNSQTWQSGEAVRIVLSE